MNKVLKIFLSSILLLLGMILFFIFVGDYLESQSLCSANDKGICLEVNSITYQQDKKNIDLLTKKFVNNNDKYKYIEFSNEEFAVFLIPAIEDASANIIHVDKIFIPKRQTDKNYELIFHIRVFNISIGWIKIDFVKDGGQTVYIYIKNISWNNVSMNFLLLNKMNYAIKESIFYINNENYSKFVFDNIEFIHNKIVIKGHYTEDYY